MGENLDLSIWEHDKNNLVALSRKLDEIRQHVKHCGAPQPQFLYCLSSMTEGRGAIVEIGTHTGSSLMALASAQKARQGMPVYTIDRVEQPTLHSDLAALDLLDWARIILSDSAEAAESWRYPIELLWIDGDHRYAGVRRDLAAWKDFVILGGRLALHDYRDGVGVARAVHELLLSEPWCWRCVSDRAYGSIIVFERVAEVGHAPWMDRLSQPPVLHQER